MVFVLGLSVLLGAGCAADKQKAPAVLASVEVRDCSPGQIADTAIEVFRGHGYDVARHAKRALTFEKPASKWSRFAYGGWTSASSVWERVALSIVPAGEAAARLECQAHLISNRGDPIEEPTKYGHVRRAPLQAMLEEIAARLREPPIEPPTP